MYSRNILFSVILFLLAAVQAMAQNNTNNNGGGTGKDGDKEEEIVLFGGVGNTPGYTFNDSTDVVYVPKTMEHCHLVGVNYSFGFSGIFSPSTIRSIREISPVNFGVTYSYLHDLWGMYSIFGIQTGLRYAKEGYSLETSDGDKYNTTFYEVIELPVASLFHFELFNRHMRILAQIGPYIGYRLSVDRPYLASDDFAANQWKDTDIRFDYGVKGGLGIAAVFAPIEIHIEAIYKHSFSSLYQPNTNSDYFYEFLYPSQFILSVGVHFQIGRKFFINDKL